MANNDKPQETPAGPNVVWDDSEMETSFANVVNAMATADEFLLFFGMNRAWNQTAQNEVRVKLGQMIALTPRSAKRLTLLLNKAVADFEKHAGPIEIEGAPRSQASVKATVKDIN